MNVESALLLLLETWSCHGTGFAIEGNRLIARNTPQAVQTLEQSSLDLIALAVCRLDNTLEERFIASSLRETAYQQLLFTEAGRLFNRLNELNIPAVLLKGPSLNPYYPDHCIRPMYDIDFLIRPDDKAPCFQILKEMGYHPVHAESAQYRIEHHGELEFRNPKNGVVLECHWDFINSPSMRQQTRYDPDLVFNPLHSLPQEQAGVSARVLAPTLLLIYLMCHHVQHHQFRGLLWLADVLAVIAKGPIEWDGFAALVRRLGVVRPVGYYLKALDRIFLDRWPANKKIRQVRHRLPVRGTLFRVLSALYPPELIFSQKALWGHFRAQVFRNAFK